MSRNQTWKSQRKCWQVGLGSLSFAKLLRPGNLTQWTWSCSGLQSPESHRIGIDFWWSCWIRFGSSWRPRGRWDPAHASAKMRSSHGNLATKACRIGEHFHFLQFPGLKSSTLPQEVILSAIMASSGLPTLHWLRWYAAELDMLTGRCPEWAIAYVFRLAILILCH